MSHTCLSVCLPVCHVSNVVKNSYATVSWWKPINMEHRDEVCYILFKLFGYIKHQNKANEHNYS
jgi:hypothetical protein